MGNTPEVSHKHYKMMLPDQFEMLKAEKSATKKSAQKSGTKMARQPLETGLAQRDAELNEIAEAWPLLNDSETKTLLILIRQFLEAKH